MRTEAHREAGPVLPIAAAPDSDRAVTVQRPAIARFGAYSQPTEEVVMQPDAKTPRRPARIRGVVRVNAYPTNADKTVRREAEKKGSCEWKGAQGRNEEIGVRAPSSNADAQTGLVAIMLGPAVATTAEPVAAGVRRRSGVGARIVAVVEVQGAAQTKPEYSAVARERQPAE